MSSKLKALLTSLAVMLSVLAVPVAVFTPQVAAASGNCTNLSNCDLFDQYLNPFINFLAALVGVAVVVSIVYAGVQYGSSGGDPQKVTAAKNRIRNSLIALITFIFLFSLIKFLIPGGNIF